MKKKIILITADEHRHKFFKYSLNNFNNVDLLLCVCEDNDKRQSNLIIKSKKTPIILKHHFKKRHYYEKKIFKLDQFKKKKFKEQIFISRNELNTNTKIIKKIIDLKPDLLISYGCSLIRNNLIRKFKNKFINLHLGLSPYYKGSATNFWPIVNNELQFLGGTFMFIDYGIDSGPIIHQFRPKIKIKDNIHTIGCEIILKSIKEIKKVILNLKNLKPKKQWKVKNAKIYKRSDLDVNSLKKAKKNMNKKNIKKFLEKEKKLIYEYPILSL